MMKTPKVLVIDHDARTRRELRGLLVVHGFEVDDAGSNDEGLYKLRHALPDVILLDLKIPARKGLEMCREIRACSPVPVIVLSVIRISDVRAQAFEAGADQYVTKPCGVEELAARIRAARRRAETVHSPVLVLGEAEVNFETHQVRRKDCVVHLTAKEFGLLYCLASRPGEIVSHRRILQSVWGPDYGAEVEYLRVFVNQLRKKLEPDPGHPTIILTEPSEGYRLAIP
ncbi:MAG: response regulator transcription factor [Bryobacterales bacterium]|nr:response regulator transcription factor [Bryobacterales bacterium]